MTSPPATENAPTALSFIPARLRALPAASLDQLTRNSGQRRRLPDIRAGTGGTGMACLAMMAAWHGCTAWKDGEDQTAPEPGIADMARISHAMGLHCRPRHVDAESLEQLELPCILAWEQSAYAVLSARMGRHWLLHDPSRGPYEISTAALMQHSRAVVLEYPAARPPATTGAKRPAVPCPRHMASLRVCLPLTFLAIAAESAWLALPFLLMHLVDQVLIPGDFSALPWLAFGVFAVLAARAGLELVQHHVLAPAVANEAVIRRARGAREDDGRMTQPASRESLRQASASVLALACVVLLDWQVAMATLAVLALHGLLVHGAYRRCAKAMAAVGRDIAAERRLRQWAACPTPVSSNALKRAGLLGAWHAKLRQAGMQAAAGMAELSGRMAEERAMQALLLAWLAGQSLMMAGVWVQAGHNSAGAMLALLLLTWRAACEGRPLVESLCSAREADLPLASMEEYLPARPAPMAVDGILSLRGLGFRHTVSADWLFRDLDLHLKKGDAVILGGASGAGKTSLLRLLLGELPVSQGRLQGEIQLAASDGRTAIAAVLEDDLLLPGSVAENIARFTVHASLADIEASARAACAHEDIMALPETYETRIGEGGVPLPQGLVKRLLLARALHGRPKLLLLDEATAMLEPAMERLLLREIALQGTACLIVSRRLEAMAAMRVLRLEKPRPAS